MCDTQLMLGGLQGLDVDYFLLNFENLAKVDSEGGEREKALATYGRGVQALLSTVYCMRCTK